MTSHPIARILELILIAGVFFAIEVAGSGVVSTVVAEEKEFDYFTLALWEKHGTCAAPVTGGQYNFFQTAINLYSAYNVSEVIFGAGYVPSNSETYPSSGIISALENAFHATPQIKCKNGALQDLRICFTKDFKFRDCVGESKCPNDVSLPEPDVTRIAGLSVFGHESS